MHFYQDTINHLPMVSVVHAPFVNNVLQKMVAITCKLPKESRPSMEAAGMDVFKTVRNAGLELEVQNEINQDDLRMYTLLLLE